MAGVGRDVGAGGGAKGGGGRLSEADVNDLGLIGGLSGATAGGGTGGNVSGRWCEAPGQANEPVAQKHE